MYMCANVVCVRVIHYIIIIIRCPSPQRMEDTAKSNFAGGDTNWEEEKLGSYANR